MSNMKSLSLIVAPTAASISPKLRRRQNFIERLEEQRELAKNPNHTISVRRWIKDAEGVKQLIEIKKRIKPWWSKDPTGSLYMVLKSGLTRFRPSPYVIATERATQTSPAAIANLFAAWYRSLGFIGASSHSGRRTAITGWARKISTVGGSLRDIQLLAGHSALSITQRYIEADGNCKSDLSSEWAETFLDLNYRDRATSSVINNKAFPAYQWLSNSAYPIIKEFSLAEAELAKISEKIDNKLNEDIENRSDNKFSLENIRTISVDKVAKNVVCAAQLNYSSKILGAYAGEIKFKAEVNSQNNIYATVFGL